MRWGLLIVLVLAGSCAPERRPLVSQVVPERPATLLRKLALDVPADVARLPLIAERGETVARIAAAPAFVDPARSLSDAERARDCLTTAIYYEARSEPVDGQRAVAQVVLNRVRDRAFPASVCGVVFQGSNRRTGCQFSFTCDGSMNRRRDPGAWARAGLIAEAALAGEVYAPVGSATHFHTTAISPWWSPSLTRLGTVGTHVFYRWPRAMERALAFRQSYAGYEPSLGGGGGVAADAGAHAIASGETAHGVTIHRGIGPVPVAPTEAGEPAAAPAFQAASVMTATGVRVHRGVEMPARISAAVRVHRGVAPDEAAEEPATIVQDAS